MKIFTLRLKPDGYINQNSFSCLLKLWEGNYFVPTQHTAEKHCTHKNKS